MANNTGNKMEDVQQLSLQKIAAIQRGMAAQFRLQMLITCKELVEVGGRGYLPEEDELVYRLADQMHKYSTLRRLMSDLGITLEGSGDEKLPKQ